MKRTLAPLLIALAAPWALAKLPAPVLDDAAKAKAEEAKARSAWQAKLDAFQLCRAQDRVVAHFRQGGSKPSSASTNGSGGTPSAGASASAQAVATAGTGPTVAPCVDPGPFAYTPPAQMPLEAAGAHSPAANPGTPPSVREPAAQLDPARK